MSPGWMCLGDCRLKLNFSLTFWLEAVKTHHSGHYHTWIWLWEYVFGSYKSKNHKELKFHLQLAKLSCFHFVDLFSILTLLNTLCITFWNKWYLIWKPEYSAFRIRNKIRYVITRGYTRLGLKWLDIYGTPCTLNFPSRNIRN